MASGKSDWGSKKVLAEGTQRQMCRERKVTASLSSGMYKQFLEFSVTMVQEIAKRLQSLGVGFQTIVVYSLKGRVTPGGQSSPQRELASFRFLQDSFLSK
jgi:hypothetical protein